MPQAGFIEFSRLKIEKTAAPPTSLFSYQIPVCRHQEESNFTPDTSVVYTKCNENSAITLQNL